jgi:hypothetical protein
MMKTSIFAIFCSSGKTVDGVQDAEAERDPFHILQTSLVRASPVQPEFDSVPAEEFISDDFSVHHSLANEAQAGIRSNRLHSAILNLPVCQSAHTLLEKYVPAPPLAA